MEKHHTSGAVSRAAVTTTQVLCLIFGMKGWGVMKKLKDTGDRGVIKGDEVYKV